MIFIDNKYTHWYYAIIHNVQNRITSDYTERHHIVPQSMGGDNSANNIVRLTAKEHFICHLLLTKMVLGKDKIKMYNAAFQMSVSSNNQSRYRITSRTYTLLKKIKSTAMLGNSYGSHTMSAETKEKISKAKLGKPNFKARGIPKSIETKNKISLAGRGKTAWNIGKVWDESTKKKISEARQNTKKIKCIYCNKEVSPSNWSRWHNDNCKQK